jgi:hypothetical protein
MRTEIENNLIRDYLLGDLSESEASLLEQEIFTVGETFERIWEIENMLVDGYVRGRLSSEDRERFERHYLASPVHRRRVVVAEELIKRADGSRAGPSRLQSRASWRAKLPLTSGAPFSLPQLALAAAMLLLVTGTLWLFLDRMRLRSEPARLTIESEARLNREQQVADQHSSLRGRNEKLAAELERMRSRQHTRAPQSTGRPQEQSSHSNVFSLLLSPLLSRSGGKPQILTIPAKTEMVHLRMRAVLNDTRTFQVRLRTIEGRQVVEKQQTVKSRIDDPNSAVITAQIPAQKLAQGDYILTLSAVDSAGEPEEVNRYFFRVTKQR